MEIFLPCRIEEVKNRYATDGNRGGETDLPDTAVSYNGALKASMLKNVRGRGCDWRTIR